MPYQKIALFVSTFIVLIALILGVALYLNESQSSNNEEITYVITPIADGSYTGEYPPLDHEVQFSSNYPEDARATVRSKVEEVVSQLSVHPEDGSAWMDLALWYHTANDHDAARVVWEFILELSPTNTTVLNNLGRMYHFDTPDFPKSEEYFKRALEINPGRVDAYLELFDLYRYSYKTNTPAAVDIMRQAIRAFPDDAGLVANLAGYYRDHGQKGLARAEFEKAIQIARDQNDVNLVGALNAELANL